LSYPQIRALQNQRLHEFINKRVYPFNPHYRKLFDDNHIDPRGIRGVGDLARIPFSTKLDLVSKDDPQKFKEFVLAPDKARLMTPAVMVEALLRGKEAVQDRLVREYQPVFMTFTTGTTNTPVPFVYSRYDLDNLNLSGARMVELFKIGRDERIMNIFPFAPHLAFWQVLFGAIEGGVFAFSTGGGRVMSTEGHLAALARVKPTAILGVPSYVYHLVRLAQEKGQDLSYIKKIVLGAAKAGVGYKQKLAQMLSSQGAKDVRIFGTYGLTEARSAWAECPADNDKSSGYHLYPDKEIFEIIDPKTGEVKGEGEDGELVYTPLDGRASIVLRYRTGDFVKGGITHERCPFCGLMTLRLSNDISRLSDTKDLNLSKVKGTLVNLNLFASVLNDMPEVEEWQIELRKHNNDPHDVDELAVLLSVKGSVDESAFASKVKDKLTVTTEITPNEVKFLPLAEMVKRLELETANKEKRILDLRPKG